MWIMSYTPPPDSAEYEFIHNPLILSLSVPVQTTQNAQKFLFNIVNTDMQHQSLG